jgi:hypothetical protein
MFNLLQIYEFKFSTKNGKSNPEKFPSQKDKKIQRSVWRPP